jgi:hypothetical protein
MLTIQEFVKKHELKLILRPIDSRPDLVGRGEDDWNNTATHWWFTLRSGTSSYSGYYSQGSALKDRPTIEEILDSLAMDVFNLDITGFEEWATEYGYDTDSRKAEKIYKACERASKALRKFLGDDAIDELINDVERL